MKGHHHFYLMKELDVVATQLHKKCYELIQELKI